MFEGIVVFVFIMAIALRAPAVHSTAAFSYASWKARGQFDDQ